MYIQICMYDDVCTFVCIYVCMCVYIYIYLFIDIGNEV